VLAELGKPTLRMNYAAMTAALGADLGLSAREFQLFRVPLFMAGMPPCLVEAADKPEGALFPIPCDAIAYDGQEKRAWRR
jgi:citrate synthase